MRDAVIMGVVADNATYPPGTPVRGTDYNAAYAALLRWFGLLDAPAGVDTSRFWDDLVDDDLALELPGVEHGGPSTPADAVARLRTQAQRSHQLGFDGLTLVWLGRQQYQLEATVLEQTRDADGVVASRTCTYRALLRKRPDGIMVFRSIALAAEEAEVAAAFVPTYEINRAKATMVQFQTHTDLLTGDAVPMRELLMPALELNGLVNSKSDSTRGEGENFTDVRSLRETISDGERRQDNVIRTFEEFAAWFASCTALFRPNGFHKLERFEVSPLPDRRFEVIAQFHWQAETLNGAAIDLHTPLTWILVDTDEKYMRIERLLPFG